MDIHDFSQAVIVFDLDDTLYPELDYQTSGIRFVAQEIRKLYNMDIEKELFLWRDSGHTDIWQQACRLLNLPDSLSEQMLWMYRLHNPDIRLSDDSSNILRQLHKLAKQVVILTDGRSVSQRRKLSALGLENIPVYISEEYQSAKPESSRFISIMQHFTGKTYLYIGDNPQKDFVAPNQLGWTTIGLINKISIHSQKCEFLPIPFHPNYWINSWDELLPLLRRRLKRVAFNERISFSGTCT